MDIPNIAESERFDNGKWMKYRTIVLSISTYEGSLKQLVSATVDSDGNRIMFQRSDGSSHGYVEVTYDQLQEVLRQRDCLMQEFHV